MGSRKSCSVVLVLVVMGLFIMMVSSSMEEDEKECADQLANMASCIPYVSGDAKEPTKECCEDTVKVRSNKPKCLCVLIKESTDPSMGLPVNTTLAMQMPAACKIDAKVSDCPSILKLPPNSPDAKIFQQTAAGSASTTPPSSPSASISASDSGSTSGSGSKAAADNNKGSSLNSSGIGSVIGLMACFAWLFM